MKLVTETVDMTKVKAVVYHLPDGESLTVKLDGLEHFIEFGYGKICDTSDIDGLLHFFPEGNA